MRLLDAVCQAQRSGALSVAAETAAALPSAADLAPLVQATPLRLVLGDDVVRYCTAFGFADGIRLTGCLDLVRIPAQRLWIEWSERARREVLESIPEVGCGHADVPEALRAGVLIDAAPDGRQGMLRTFWNTACRPDAPLLAPMRTHFSLDTGAPSATGLDGAFGGQPVTLTFGANVACDPIYRKVWLELDPSWARYYRQRAMSTEERFAILRASAATVALDIPMLFALTLFMNAPQGLHQREVRHDRLNRARARRGRGPLLDHIEVNLPFPTADAARACGPSAPAAGQGAGRRLHHVRGHLVRRGTTLYWRVPHLRGDMRSGLVRSRTVTLRLSQQTSRTRS